MTGSTEKTIEIIVNGEPKCVPEGVSVHGLLLALELPADRVAVELNRNIVRQPAWESTRVDAGAQVEIVQFVGGG